MTYTDEQLNQIYDRTSGYCHICTRKLAFKNYHVFGARGAWEVDHSNPKANGGTNRSINLYAACISCNRSKSHGSTRSARAANGCFRAPLDLERRKKAKFTNALAAAAIGTIIGAPFGPPGTLLCATIGAHLGYKKNPDK